jgi:ORF6N domain-containing protein
MKKTKQTISTITEESVVEKIHLIRGVKVMLDRDLAEMYDVDTRILKQAVKRNIVRFPEDFMFEMSPQEFKNWRSQFVMSNSDKMGLRHPPFCFTEQGVAMLSSVLHSETAIAVNIQIIRVFTKMKQLLLDNKELFLKIEKIERKLTEHDEDIQNIFKVLKKLLQPEPVKRKTIGFPYPNKK